MPGFALLVFGFAALAPASRAATSCPWLTQGSAEAVLGGKVSAVVTLTPSSGEGVCTFSRAGQPPDLPDSLKIVVERRAVHWCPAGSPALKGIGNEAVTCTARPSATASTQIIVSRVRNLHFMVRLTTHTPAARKQPSDATEATTPVNPIEQVAEQVAGNLF